jgi:hypothetical protein
MFMKDEIIVVLKVLSEGEDYLVSCTGKFLRFYARGHQDIYMLIAPHSDQYSRGHVKV